MLITNAHIFRSGPKGYAFEEGDLYIKDGVIQEISIIPKELHQKYPHEEKINAGNRYLLPGLINTHTHFYSGLARGIPLPPPAPSHFLDILKQLWWKLDKQLDPDAIYYSAAAALIDSIRNGTTTFIDHHASPFACPGSLDILEKASADFGIRACFCYEVSDRDGKDIAQQGIQENIRYLEKCRKSKTSQFQTLFGLHASFTLSDDTLKAAVEAAQSLDTGFHIHCAEGMADLEDAKARGYHSVVDRLHRMQITGPKSIFAHCIRLTSEDISILKETGTTVIHNPQSNMNNAVGMADINQLLQQGIPVGLGSDGWNDGMLYELRQAIFTAKLVQQDAAAGFSEAVELLWNQNPKIVSRIFNQNIGTITPGAVADLIIMDYHPNTPDTGLAGLGHVVYGLSNGTIDTVITQGEVIFRHGEFTLIDEAAIQFQAQQTAARLWKKF